MSEKIIDRNYGSIPHLSSSKMSQQADKKISIGQENILTKKPRDWKDLVIVTEKIDGSNVGVVKTTKGLFAITRHGYSAISSPFKQHHYFHEYVLDNDELFSWLPIGWRVCGEWCAMAHGTLYDITDESPFVAFDIFDGNNSRIPYMYFFALCHKYDIPVVPLLHIGQPISIKNAIDLLGSGHYGKPEKPEGVVYRSERLGEFDFMAKWVRGDKVDGEFMDKEIWNKGFNV